MKLTGAEIVMKVLLENEVDTVFGYPGGSVLNIYDEIYKYSDKITHVTTCHEQGAAHAADGYARATGKTGVVFATSGPGATNLVTGIATAYLDSTPMVAITGNVATAFIGRDSFQEVDICGVTMPVTKHNFIVKDVNKLADTIREAFRYANSGRPGPVLVDIPKDVQTATAEYEPCQKSARTSKHRNGVKAFETALEIIQQSKKPFIYAGGGVVSGNASEALSKFADMLDAPIGTSMMGITGVSVDNPRYLGMAGMHGKYCSTLALAKSDLIIAIGARFSDRATGNKTKFADGKKVLHIDIDPAEIGKNIPAYVALIGDVKDVLTRLMERLPAMNRPEWEKEVLEIKNCPDSRLEMERGKLTPQAVIEAINKNVDKSTPIVTDVGQHQMWVAQYYKFREPRTFLTSGGLGTMGFGMGAAMGAAIGTGKRAVLFTSDGGFHMNMNEMATAVSNNIPLTIVVLNNNALGMVRQWQTIFFEKRYSHTSLERQTDYVKLANAFGVPAKKIDSLDQMESVLKESVSKDGPYLVEVIIDPDERVLPMIPPNGTIKDIILR